MFLDHFGGGCCTPTPRPGPAGGGSVEGTQPGKPPRTLDERRRQFEDCVARARSAKNQKLTEGIGEDVAGGLLVITSVSTAGLAFNSGSLGELAEEGVGSIDAITLGGRYLAFGTPGYYLYGRGVLDTVDALNTFDRAQAECALRAGYPDIPLVP